jgi:betaine-aldehyde dehydrogenase
MGPLISARQRERVTTYVDGASVALQGSVPSGRGFWFAPTVLFPAGDDDRAVREEISGRSSRSCRSTPRPR